MEREIIEQLQEKLDRKTKEVQDLTHELEQTNEGLIALYMELDDANKKLAESNHLLKEQEKKLIAYLFDTVNKTRNPVVNITRNCSLLEEMAISGTTDANDVKLIIEVIKSNAKMINENIVELNKVAIDGSDRILESYRGFLTDE